ncbi:MAG: hypothetical protein JWQ42_424 [Edaphobacter sp.]|nr:hypothetical protein [Edaphobacter sp.]
MLCRRNVPAGVEVFPFNWNTVVACPLCGEVRRYRPTEVFLGWVDGLVEEQKASRRFRPFTRKPPNVSHISKSRYGGTRLPPIQDVGHPSNAHSCDEAA